MFVCGAWADTDPVTVWLACFFTASSAACGISALIPSGRVSIIAGRESVGAASITAASCLSESGTEAANSPMNDRTDSSLAPSVISPAVAGGNTPAMPSGSRLMSVCETSGMVTSAGTGGVTACHATVSAAGAEVSEAGATTAEPVCPAGTASVSVCPAGAAGAVRSKIGRPTGLGDVLLPADEQDMKTPNDKVNAERIAQTRYFFAALPKLSIKSVIFADAVGKTPETPLKQRKGAYFADKNI